MDLQTIDLKPLLADLPNPLRGVFSNHWARFVEALAAEQLLFSADSGFLQQLVKVWVASQFVAEYCIRNPLAFVDLKNSGRLSARLDPAAYRNDLNRLEVASEEELMRALRCYRNREMVRIAWRDITGLAGLTETLTDLSLLAEASLQRALDWLYPKACERFGTPRLRNGQAQGLVVLGMGKLGARELNFSSDIDLIFAFEEEGILSAKKEKSHAEFFTNLGRALVRVIDTVTTDGFVFRVDLRLRPFGESGPLVMSFDAMEAYYQRQAREWERYAFIKARTVAGDLAAGFRLETMLQPFVYRRYLDFGSYQELRKLKQKIGEELNRKDRLDNIKLGSGGIREIEFIAQAYQLIRGGRDSRLQERGLLKVLATLKEKSLLPARLVEKLETGYEFLRTLENRLQQSADQQVHDLPDQPIDQLRIAYALGYEDWAHAKRRIDHLRAQIHDVFEQVFVSPQSDRAQGDAEVIWTKTDDPEDSIRLLERMGYRDALQAFSMLNGFRNALAVRKLSARGAGDLDQLMPLVLGAVAQSQDPDEVLKRILGLVESIASRKAYLSLLVENPLALSQLVKLASASAWIVSLIARHPILLDELLDARALYAPLTRSALIQELDQRLADLDRGDLEQQMARLREFKQANVLKIAAADIAETIPVAIVSDRLTEVAEVVLDRVLHLAWRLITEKHGTLPDAQFDQVCGFAVIGYGKLGGFELGYGSDLDLVFLYAHAQPDARTKGPRPITCAQFYTKVGQRIINLLDTKMLAGLLYETDMRLRPSGNSGCLVSSLESFEQYQHNQAWTWEHQALVRARFVAGDPELGRKFDEVRAKTLAQVRDPQVLKKDVCEMREKMRENLAKTSLGCFDLKQGAGAIVDIEFMVHFGVLLNAHQNLRLVQFPDVLRLLDILPESGFLSLEEAKVLKVAYLQYRKYTHRAALKEGPAFVPEDQLLEVRAQVQRIWRRAMA